MRCTTKMTQCWNWISLICMSMLSSSVIFQISCNIYIFQTLFQKVSICVFKPCPIVYVLICISNSDLFLEVREVDLDTLVSREPPASVRCQDTSCIAGCGTFFWASVQDVELGVVCTIFLVETQTGRESQYFPPTLPLSLSCSSISTRNLAIVSTSSLAGTFVQLLISLGIYLSNQIVQQPFWSCWPPKWHRCWRRPWWWRPQWQRCGSGSSRSLGRQKVVASSSRRLRRPEWPFNKLF